MTTLTKKIQYAVLTCAALLVSLLNLEATDSFPETVERNGQKLHLSGTGTFVYRIFFSVYDAAFYSAEDVRAAQIPGDVPMRLVIRYRRDVERDVFTESAAHYLEENLSEAELEAIAERLAMLNKHYQDVKEGDRYTLVYMPGEGTTLELNDEPQVTIKGADFAAAYFTIWLGKKPLDEDLRDDLLKGLE